MGKVIDLTGRQFGRLTVIERAEGYVSPQGKTSSGWRCHCECGATIIAYSKDLLSRHTQSCGCFRRELTGRRRAVHRQSRSRLYNIWNGMKQRCNNPSNKSYKNYGGRGITICDEWLTDFCTFHNWAMDNGYADDLSIDRIDNDKGYSPDNCRWATKVLQNRNVRTNRKIEMYGENLTLAEWCERYGKSYKTVHKKINKLGKSIEEALGLNSQAES